MRNRLNLDGFTTEQLEDLLRGYLQNPPESTCLGAQQVWKFESLMVLETLKSRRLKASAS
jgi:hypothetical protein